MVIDGRRLPDDDYQRDLGDMLRAVRRHLGRLRGEKITLDSAAMLIEIDAGTLGRWERGENVPKVENLWKIAEAYRIPREWWWLFLEPGQFAPSHLREIWSAIDILSPEAAAAADLAADEVAARVARRADVRSGGGEDGATDSQARTDTRGAA